jgi:hypothetical protein
MRFFTYVLQELRETSILCGTDLRQCGIDPQACRAEQVGKAARISRVQDRTGRLNPGRGVDGDNPPSTARITGFDLVSSVMLELHGHAALHGMLCFLPLIHLARAEKPDKRSSHPQFNAKAITGQFEPQ